MTVTSTDGNTRGVDIEVTEDPYVFGEGESVTYRVRLETEPSGTVTITPSSTNGDISFNPGSLSFNIGDWNTFKTMEVTAEQDGDAAAEDATVTHTVTGADYGDNGVTADDVALDIADDDMANVVVSAAILTITEGTGGAYTISLGSRPVGGNVTITLTPPTNPDITVDKTELTFTTTNWDDAQTITVSAAHDTDTQADTGTITHVVAGANFAGATIPDILVTVTEDDEASISIEPRSLLTIGEGNSATYTVVLGTEPSGDVTLLASSNNNDVNLSPSTLTFTFTNWDEAQVVTARASADADATNDVATITHTASGHEYEGEAGPSVSVLVVEDGTSVKDTSSFLRSSSCDSTLSLSWNAPVDASVVIDKFKIEWGTESPLSGSETINGDEHSYVLESLDNGTVYTIRVQALDSASMPLWSREVTAMPSKQACITSLGFGNILADSAPVIVEIEDPDPETTVTVNMRYRSLNPGVWSDVQSQTLDEGDPCKTTSFRRKPESRGGGQTGACRISTRCAVHQWVLQGSPARTTRASLLRSGA